MRALVLVSLATLVGCAATPTRDTHVADYLGTHPIQVVDSRDDAPEDTGSGGGIGLNPEQMAVKTMLAGGMGVGGLKSISGGPNEHSGQDMTAKSITLSQASGVALYAGSTTDVFASFAGNVAGGSNGTMRYNTTNGWEMYGVGIYAAGRIHSASTTSVGSITLSAGSGTATTFSGAKCVCTDTTANASVKCAVSGTTLTATGTTTDVIAYVCL
jgi:hypothetical protein